jgi:hypothetical protein
LSEELSDYARVASVLIPTYWTTAANVILRVKAEMLQERIAGSTTLG